MSLVSLYTMAALSWTSCTLCRRLRAARRRRACMLRRGRGLQQRGYTFPVTKREVVPGCPFSTALLLLDLISSSPSPSPSPSLSVSFRHSPRTMGSAEGSRSEADLAAAAAAAPSPAHTPGPKPGDGVGQDSALNAQQPHARAQHPSHAPLHPTRRADNNNSQGGVFGPSHGDGDGDNDDGDNDNGDDNNDNDNADMSNLTHRRMSIAQEASSSRSSISQSRTPTFPPPPAAGPSRPTPGFSWFSPTEPKDEDGHGSDHSTAQATRSKAKSKRRAVKQYAQEGPLTPA